MARDLPDVWRDEDGPHPSEVDGWASGEFRSVFVDNHRRRIIRWALKSAWQDSMPADQLVIDALLDDLKR